MIFEKFLSNQVQLNCEELIYQVLSFGERHIMLPLPRDSVLQEYLPLLFFLVFLYLLQIFIIWCSEIFSLVVDTWYCTLHSFIYLGEQKWKTSLASQPIWSASYIETLSINLFSLSDPIVIITTIIQFANVTITLSCQSYLPWWNLNFLFLSFVHLITKVIVPSPGERLSQSGQQSIVTCIYKV